MAQTDAWKWWVAGGAGALVVGGCAYWGLGRRASPAPGAQTLGTGGGSHATPSVQPGRVVLGAAIPAGVVEVPQQRPVDMAESNLLGEFVQTTDADRRQALRNELQWRGIQVPLLPGANLSP